ncbi:glycosyltransferase [Parabacteroides distasonis]|nr:glycosyltransferase [Parabacteroides distasonis]
MKVLSIDITGKVSIYDNALFASLLAAVTKEDEWTGLTPYRKVSNVSQWKKRLFCLIPEQKAHAHGLLKRSLKAMECLLNYIRLLALIRTYRPDVLHLQWLPFLEVNGWEVSILRWMRRLHPQMKMVLTMHNIYPHNMGEDRKRHYNVRFRKASDLIDAFIVHTRISKAEVVREFGLNPMRVHVCCHGVFEPKAVTISSEYKRNGKLHILQFGGQSYYKGTDLLVDAVCGLDDDRKKRIETHIIGGIGESFLSELKGRDKAGIIQWKPYYLSDEELYQEINAADLIVLPYRAISQSGVLLLSIYFEKLIICSDLPSFKETMQGDEGDVLDDVLFFKSEDVRSLRKLIMRYVDGNVEEDAVRKRVQHLRSLYSWESAAKATWDVYHSLKV